MGLQGVLYVRITLVLFNQPRHGIHVIKKQRIPFIGNLAGTENYYISTNERNA